MRPSWHMRITDDNNVQFVLGECMVQIMAADNAQATGIVKLLHAELLRLAGPPEPPRGNPLSAANRAAIGAEREASRKRNPDRIALIREVAIKLFIEHEAITATRATESAEILVDKLDEWERGL